MPIGLKGIRFLTRKSQLGSDPFAPLLAYCNTALAFGVRP
jgi:hypothetical protein